MPEDAKTSLDEHNEYLSEQDAVLVQVLDVFAREHGYMTVATVAMTLLSRSRIIEEAAAKILTKPGRTPE